MKYDPSLIRSVIQYLLFLMPAPIILSIPSRATVAVADSTMGMASMFLLRPMTGGMEKSSLNMNRRCVLKRWMVSLSVLSGSGTFRMKNPLAISAVLCMTSMLPILPVSRSSPPMFLENSSACLYWVYALMSLISSLMMGVGCPRMIFQTVLLPYCSLVRYPSRRWMYLTVASFWSSGFVIASDVFSRSSR